jgi:hypothetical protein
MKMKLFAKLGLVALATTAFLEVGFPAKADQPKWVKTERVQFLQAVGTRSLRGRLHRISAAKVEQENAVQASQLPQNNERWLNIYKSLSFLGGA